METLPVDSLLLFSFGNTFLGSLPLQDPFTTSLLFSVTLETLTSSTSAFWFFVLPTAACFPHTFVIRRNLSMTSWLMFSLFTSTLGPFRLRSPRVICRGWLFLDPKNNANRVVCKWLCIHLERRPFYKRTVTTLKSRFPSENPLSARGRMVGQLSILMSTPLSHIFGCEI